MEKTSYLVKPELYTSKEEKQIVFIEDIIEVIKENESLILKTEDISLYMQFYEAGIIRIITYNEKFDLFPSFVCEKLTYCDFEYSTNIDETIVTFLNIKVVIKHKPFSFMVYKDEKLKYIQKAIGFCENESYLLLYRNKNDYIYGLGEKTGFLNKNNDKTINWNKDVFEPHTRSNKELYQSINMFTYMSSSFKYGMFIDNASKVTFNFSDYDNDALISTEIGKLDYYILTGDSLKEIISDYTLITGKTHLPPLWALGYHQSRHSYQNENELLNIYQNFKNREIPVDAIYLDILYMDRYKVFTFDKKRFPNIEKIIKKLKADGIKIVPIVDPGVKVEKGYHIYEEGIKNNLFCLKDDNLVFTGDVWPGVSAFYDFLDEKAQKAWGENHRFYTDMGIEGIWNDMNEPSVFNTPNKTMTDDVIHNTYSGKKTHKEVHNLYGLAMSKATYEGLFSLLNKKPFVLTRAGYAGIQKYAFVWTGDNRSSWEHLEMTLPMCMNLNMSGVSLCGVDIGGFMDDCFEELFIRWIEVGVFLPFFRNHCSIGLRPQEPWAFGEECEKIVKRFIRLRYELIYYIYSVIYNAHLTGIPVMRPLVLEYENDDKTYSIHDQFMLGSNLLIAPILRPGEKNRKVYLPEGLWYDFFTNKKYEGNNYYIIDAQLDEIPVFVKGNSIIPLTKWAMNTEKLTKDIVVFVYPKDKEFSDYFIVETSENTNCEYAKIIVNYHNGDVKLDIEGKNEFNINIKIIK